jgi:MSHA biogenesis protein MshQ
MPATDATFSRPAIPVALDASSTATCAATRVNAGDPFRQLDIGLKIPNVLDSININALDINADTSGTCSGGNCTARRIGSTGQILGRLRLSNVFGSVSPLAMPVQAQYWSGLTWVTNADDSCTTLTGIFSAPPANWAWPAASPPAPVSTVTLSSGIGTLYLSGPKPGTATVTAGGVPAWLRSTWGGVANPPPSAAAAIGIYAPETRRTVHVQEEF